MMTIPTVPTLEDVRAAAVAIEPYLSLPTPLVRSPALSELVDAEVSLKLEFATPIGVFKLRGGLNLAGQLSDNERAAGLVTASTGNHGQSVAYAAHLHGARAVIFVPEGANADKIAAMERLGAEVRTEGDRFDDCIRLAHSFADATGMRFVSAGDEPALISGVGTAGLEVLESQQPGTDVVIVPVGGGSGASGWCVVRDGLRSASEVWGVQSAQSAAAHDSWREGAVVTRPNLTMAEGLATGSGFELPLSIMRESLDEFLLVDDDAVGDAVVTMLEHQHLLLEPAGAAPLAAALANRERLASRRVVLVCSGANITRAQLQMLLDAS
jgi:threonine dehydratase